MRTPRSASLCTLLILFSAVSASAARQHATVTAALNLTALPRGATGVIAIVTDVPAGLHAQSAKPLDPNLYAFRITPDPNPAVDFLSPIFPRGQLKTMVGQTVDVYVGRTITFLPFRVKPDAPPGSIHLTAAVGLQACSDLSDTCFLPESIKFAVDSQIVPANQTPSPANADLFKTLDPSQIQTPPPPTTQPAISTTKPPPPPSSMTAVTLFGHTLDLQNEPVLFVAMIAFLAGVIFNIVPCVLPVLPLKAIGFYEVSQHNRARTLTLGFVFSCGLVAVFALLGILILASKSVTGRQLTWGQWFSYPIVVWLIALALAALGAGMLGAFSLRLPTSLYVIDFRHDTLRGNFMWGMFTALLSTPCTAPLFPAILGISLLLPKWEGTFLVMMVGVGMASPYFFLSAFPELARKFPRTGAASELVKQMMGFLFFGSSAFFAGQRLFGQPNQWWLVFAVIVWACLFMVIRTTQISKAIGPLLIVTGLGVAITGGGLVLTLQLTDTLAALSNAAPAGVDWVPYTDSSFADARASNHVVLVDFTADWCLNCKYVESSVYHDKKTIDALKKYGVVTIKADLTTHDLPGYKLYDQLGVTGIPYTAVYFPNDPNSVGLASIYTTDALLNVLARATPAPAEAGAEATK